MITADTIADAEQDMLYRIALAEYFTSPPRPHRLTAKRVTEIIGRLVDAGLAEGIPARITDAGRAALTDEQREQLGKLQARRQQMRTGKAPPTTGDTLTDEQIKSLSMAGEIDLDTAIVAIGLRAAKRGDSRARARARCAEVLNARRSA